MASTEFEYEYLMSVRIIEIILNSDNRVHVIDDVIKTRRFDIFLIILTDLISKKYCVRCLN